MSNNILAFLLSIGVGVWAYVKLMKYSGSNRKNSIIAAVFAGAVGFIIILLVLRKIFSCILAI